MLLEHKLLEQLWLAIIVEYFYACRNETPSLLVTLRDQLKREFKIKHEKCCSNGISHQELFAPKVIRKFVPDTKVVEGMRNVNR